jgi:hypothetical protein
MAADLKPPDYATKANVLKYILTTFGQLRLPGFPQFGLKQNPKPR